MELKGIGHESAAKFSSTDKRANQSRDADLERPTVYHRQHGAAAGTLFGTSAEFWLNLQSLYEIKLAQQKSGRAIETLPNIRGFQAAMSGSDTC